MANQRQERHHALAGIRPSWRQRWNGFLLSSLRERTGVGRLCQRQRGASIRGGSNGHQRSGVTSIDSREQYRTHDALWSVYPHDRRFRSRHDGIPNGHEPSEEGKSLQGSVEITDKFGIYSIKGSSDGRNVTINSPYGDVKIGAFTGITVSAPNGDVKIQGKNVTIEAGNNLTLVSGKNVKNKWYTTDYGSSTGANFGIAVAEAVTKKLASLVGGFADISVLRHTIEVFIRPVEGKLQVKSNRYLA